MHVTVLVLCVKHACFRNMHINMHVSGNQYECHMHVSVKLHMHHTCNAPVVFSKYAESDAAMHQ